MPFIETPDELADTIADLIGIYGAHSDGCEESNDLRTMCRCCFVSELQDRIRKSVKNESDLGKRYDDVCGNCGGPLGEMNKIGRCVIGGEASQDVCLTCLEKICRELGILYENRQRTD